MVAWAVVGEASWRRRGRVAQCGHAVGYWNEVGAVRFTNALVTGRSNGYLGLSRCTESRDDDLEREGEAPPPYTPPPFSVVTAEDYRHHNSSGSGVESDRSESADEKSRTELPSYDSVRRRSSHSLRDLLDAIEPPREPAPAPLAHQRRWSEGEIDPKVELKVVRQSETVTAVTSGERKIMHIRRAKVFSCNMSGPMPKWEVEIAEGVDLLLVSFDPVVDVDTRRN